MKNYASGENCGIRAWLISSLIFSCLEIKNLPFYNSLFSKKTIETKFNSISFLGM